MKVILSVLLAAGLAVICSGCSWVAMKRVPEDYHPTHKVECSSYGWPIVDVAFTTAFSIGAYKVSGMDVTDIATITVIIAILYAASAVTGFTWSHKCHQTREAHADWMAKPDSLRLVEADKEKKDRRRLPARAETGRKTKHTPKTVVAKPDPAVKPALPVKPEKTAAAEVEPERGPVSTSCGAFVMNDVRALWGMGVASSDHGPYTARRLANKRARREIVEMLKRNIDVFAVMSPRGIRARVSAFTRATVKKAVIVDRWIKPEEENHYSVAMLALSECELEPELANMLWERLSGGKQ